MVYTETEISQYHLFIISTRLSSGEDVDYAYNIEIHNAITKCLYIWQILL